MLHSTQAMGGRHLLLGLLGFFLIMLSTTKADNTYEYLDLLGKLARKTNSLKTLTVKNGDLVLKNRELQQALEASALVISRYQTAAAIGLGGVVLGATTYFEYQRFRATPEAEVRTWGLGEGGRRGCGGGFIHLPRPESHG